MKISLEAIIRGCGVAACVAVVAMVTLFVATGVGQDPLQFIHPPAEYARLLLAGPASLRACIAIDNLFVVLYTSVFVALALLVLRDGAHRGLVYVALGLLLVLALLDLAENFHFLVMLARAEQGITPTSTEIELQVLESLFKFHVSYLGLFLLGCALPRRVRAARWLADLSIFVQLPIGILVYVVPRMLVAPLVFARFSYFVAALVLAVRAFGGPRVAAGSGAPASLRGTMPAAVG